jgi:hypothetical protein
MDGSRSCPCAACVAGDAEARELHARMILLAGRLDEQQRRWFAAHEAAARGHGGGAEVALVLGMSPTTVRRGAEELAAGLADRPADRVRKPGGGRKRAEKKRPASSPRSRNSSNR